MKFMKDHQREYPVGKMCKVFKISKQSYYRSRNYIFSERESENRALLVEIRKIHSQSKATYGSPRITTELKARGFDVSRQRVARLMNREGIRAIQKKKFVITTDSRHSYPIVENKLNRNFYAEAPSMAWVSDITYIKTLKGWLYLTAVLDLFDRKVIGWSLSTDMTAKNTSVEAWKMAVANRPLSGKLIFHSDRGIQYACHEFASLLDSYPTVERSMSRKRNCWDNAVAESFFKTLKTELVYRNKYLNREIAALSIFEWMETWYNKNRRHSALGNMTILEFEKQHNLKKVA